MGGGRCSTRPRTHDVILLLTPCGAGPCNFAIHFCRLPKDTASETPKRTPCTTPAVKKKGSKGSLSAFAEAVHAISPDNGLDNNGIDNSPENGPEDGGGGVAKAYPDDKGPARAVSLMATWNDGRDKSLKCL